MRDPHSTVATPASGLFQDELPLLRVFWGQGIPKKPLLGPETHWPYNLPTYRLEWQTISTIHDKPKTGGPGPHERRLSSALWFISGASRNSGGTGETTSQRLANTKSSLTVEEVDEKTMELRTWIRAIILTTDLRPTNVRREKGRFCFAVWNFGTSGKRWVKDRTGNGVGGFLFCWWVFSSLRE